MQAYLEFLSVYSQATSRMDPRVLQTMLPYFTEDYGNPHSRTHIFGWSAAQAVEKAREQVAQLIGASAKEIIFTSGATECNNIAIKGVAQFYKGKKNHVITTQTVAFSCFSLPRNTNVFWTVAAGCLSADSK